MERFGSSTYRWVKARALGMVQKKSKDDWSETGDNSIGIGTIENCYSFDTNVIIDLFVDDRYPTDLYPTLLKQIELRARQNRIYVHEEVKREIRVDHTSEKVKATNTIIRAWIDTHFRGKLSKIDECQSDFVLKISEDDDYNLIMKGTDVEEESAKPDDVNADPWLLAFIHCETEKANKGQQSLIIRDLTLVTQDINLQKAAKRAGVKVVKFHDFLRKEKIKFR